MPDGVAFSVWKNDPTPSRTTRDRDEDRGRKGFTAPRSLARAGVTTNNAKKLYVLYYIYENITTE